jgi:hypothetical protein
MSITFDHKFATRNDTEVSCVKMIENAGTILADLLNVTVSLRMERMAGWGGSDAFHAGSYNRRTKLVKVNYRNLQGQTFDRILEVLSHEFRHAVQDQHGTVDTIPDTDFSMSPRRLSTSFIKYLNKANEKDARAYQEVYAKMVRADSRWTHEDTMSSRVEGELWTDDYQATYEALGLNGDDIQIFADREGNKYWFSINDVPKAKKFTKAVGQRVWKDHREQLESQPFIPLQRRVDMLDIIS